MVSGEDGSLGFFCTKDVRTVVLHNYDMHLESVKNEHQPCLEAPVEAIFITAQTDFGLAPETNKIYNMLEHDANLLSKGHFYWERMLTSQVEEKNRSRGVFCQKKEVECPLTPLQAKLLKVCKTLNLQIFIQIHPCLLLDKKIKIKGEKSVRMREDRVTLRNSISCTFYAKNARLAAPTVERLK